MNKTHFYKLRRVDNQQVILHYLRNFLVPRTYEKRNIRKNVCLRYFPLLTWM